MLFKSYKYQVQWLRLQTSTAGVTGLTPDQGTKILHATWPKNKENKLIFKHCKGTNTVSSFLYWYHKTDPSLCVLCWLAQSRPTLWDLMDCSPPGSSVHGILQARILGWVAMPSSRASSQPRDPTQVIHTAGGFFTVWAPREALLSVSSPNDMSGLT